MRLEESIGEVTRLLRMLPGVQLAWVQRTPTICRFGLIIDVPKSLGILAHVAAAANVPLLVEVDWNCPDGHDDYRCIRYDLRVPLEQELEHSGRTLQIVGGMIARRLKRIGLLHEDEMRRLAMEWRVAEE
jgi:hypothetical protein